MPLKILFMGTPKFAVPVLKSLSNSNHKILSVYTQSPKKKLRGLKIIESLIHSLSKQLKYTVKCPEDLSNNAEYDYIKELSPDVVVVVAYGKIIPKKILDISNITFLNIHASLLPKWRGAAPIQRSIMQMDEETGVTIMKIIQKLDSGPFMMQEKIKIETNYNYEDLSEKLSYIGAKLIIESLKLIEDKKANFKEQDESKVSYAKKIEKKESEMKWNIPARNLIAKINALSPFPGAWFKHKQNRLKIIKAEESHLTGQEGEVLDNDLTIGCSENSIKILKIQKEGKKSLDTKDFLSGYAIKKGEKIY